ncbi:MAG: DUF4238 domain-containing protein [Clostridia bacterium]|nr:DUF4238 domain-containing protein [Clostridia bacterium]
MKNSKMQRPIKQHYVPRFYLKEFSITENKQYYIYDFNKSLGRSYKTNIRKVACDKYFYDALKKNPNYSIEESLSFLESKLSPVYKKIINLKDINHLSEVEKGLLAVFIILQWRRTREQRNNVEGLIKSSFENQKRNRTDVNTIEKINSFGEFVCNNEGLIRCYHNMAIYSNIEYTTKVLLNMGWTLYINQTDRSYWTSDNPVVIDSPKKDDSEYSCPIQKGCKIYFPLTPKTCLLLYDSAFFEFPSKIFDTSLQSVLEKNIFHIEQSTRHIYSHDDFTPF